MPFPSPPAPPVAASSAPLARRLEAEARARPDLRIWAVEIDGQRYWIKRRERLKLRLRLQKGNPERAFARERLALPLLAEAGLPVPPIIAQGSDFFAVADAGRSVQKLLRTDDVGAEERRAAFAATGEALAAFHLAGFAHGHPRIKDFCWKDGRITVIDFERFNPSRNGLVRRRNDLLTVVFSALAEIRGPAPEVMALARAYRAAAPGETWEAAERFCRRMAWVAPLLRPLLRFDGRKGEWSAVPETLRFFSAQDRRIAQP